MNDNVTIVTAGASPLFAERMAAAVAKNAPGAKFDVIQSSLPLRWQFMEAFHPGRYTGTVLYLDPMSVILTDLSDVLSLGGRVATVKRGGHRIVLWQGDAMASAWQAFENRKAELIANASPSAHMERLIGSAPRLEKLVPGRVIVLPAGFRDPGAFPPGGACLAVPIAGPGPDRLPPNSWFRLAWENGEARCTANTPRCPDAREYTVDLRPCCRSHIVLLMREMSERLDAAGVRWWIDYGTLLGAVRNPLLGLPAGIIPHDKDGDCSFLGDDVEKFRDVVNAMNDAGYWVTYSKPKRAQFTGGNRWKVKLSTLNHTNIDFFPWYLRDDGRYHRTNYIDVDRCKGREFPPEKLFPLQRIEWEGMMLPAPADLEWFCAHRYGPNWMTPIRKNNDGVLR